MMWDEESSMFDEVMGIDQLLNSLYMDQPTETLPRRNLPGEEELSLGALLLQVLLAAVIRFSWLLWRLSMSIWILLYYPYIRCLLNIRIPFFVGLTAWLVLLTDHDPLSFTTRGRPAGVWFTSADLYQLWYWFAAPILCRTVYHFPSLLRDIHAKAAQDFNDAIEVDIGLSEYVIECYKPTPPQSVSDYAFRLLLREIHLDRVDANIDNPEYDRKSRTLLPRVESNAHLGWDKYSEVLDKRKQRRAACHKGPVVHRLRLGPDGQLAADTDGKRETPNILIVEYSHTDEPNPVHLLEWTLQKMRKTGTKLNDLPVPSTGGRVLTDDLGERCGPNNECIKASGISSPSLTVETSVDKGAKFLSSTEIPDDQKQQTEYVRASEELELSLIDVDDDVENELTADCCGKKEHVDSPEALLTTDEEMRSGPITLKTEHTQTEDIVAARGTAAEEHWRVSEMDLDMLDGLPNDVQILPSAEAQLTPNPTEQQQPILEENYSKSRYGSEETYRSPEKGPVSTGDHQTDSDEFSYAAQKPVSPTAENDFALRSAPLALGNERDVVEIIKPQEMRMAIQMQLPFTSEPEPTAEDLPLTVDDGCDSFENEVSKKIEDDANFKINASVLTEIISQSKSRSDSNDKEKDEAFFPLWEQITQEDGDQAMADFLEPEFQEESDEMNIDSQEDCDMFDELHPDVFRSEEWCPHENTIAMDIDDMEDLAMDTGDMEDANSQQEIEMVHVSGPETLDMQTPGVADRWVHVTLAGISDEQPAAYTMSQQMQTPIDSCHLMKAMEIADSDPLKSQAKLESAEAAVMGKNDTVSRGSRVADLNDEKNIFSGNGDEKEIMSAVRNTEIHESQGPRKIFHSLDTSISLVSATRPNEAGFERVDGKTSFDFEEIQCQEDEKLERELVAAYNAEFGTQNVLGALEESESEENISSHNCKSLSNGSVSNDELVEAGPSTNSSDRPDNPVRFHGDDARGKKCYKTHKDGETETDDQELPCPQRGKVGDIAAESQSQIPPIAPRTSRRLDHDEPDQAPQPFSQASSGFSLVRKSTSEQKGRENPVQVPKEYGDESSSTESDTPKEPKDKAYRKLVDPEVMGRPVLPSGSVINSTTLQASTHTSEPDQDAPAHLRIDGLNSPAGNLMHVGSPSQLIADPSTSTILGAKSSGPSETGRLEKVKNTYMKAKRRPPRLFHDKTGRAPSTPHGTRSIGSIERDEQLKSSDGMKSLNRQYSTSTQTAEGMGKTDHRRPIKVIPI
ncbi:hypothetical protein MAC_07282 [Metarhizium acridum CQMa 102]|uniref:Uncharacterized protein n=1 Tax=Metarhizium acridum (strain CQMa 102) TaxID=655827 RepID=E9EBN4_METAQ|nr:uncharacterized protein MAC_07282 [Metarhizium acridum CQMa 102]EFY86684.1 hypothetical protein MAC_07282 [Metarhizium acridum CQMa 102]